MVSPEIGAAVGQCTNTRRTFRTITYRKLENVVEDLRKLLRRREVEHTLRRLVRATLDLLSHRHELRSVRGKARAIERDAISLHVGLREAKVFMGAATYLKF